MSPTVNPNTNNIDSIVQVAIDTNLGDISSLPPPAKAKIVEVYRNFFKAYINIGQVKGLSKQEIVQNIAELDQDLVGYMQHFFSDYQQIFQSFMRLNHLVRKLVQIDGAKHPKRYNEHVNALMAGQNLYSDDLVFNQLNLD